jgi:3',5'-cyclic AMP phosphodiesterase CpdA
MRIILATDSHVGAPEAPFDANWLAVKEYARQSGADLTIHLGDITLDGANDPAQFARMQQLSDNWPSRLLHIPGNHDIGDNPPAPGVAAQHPLDLDRLAQYRAAFGADYWASDAGSWRLVGINAQLLGTGTAEEAAQWAWLEAEAEATDGRPVVLLSHKPLYRDDPLAATPPDYRYVPPLPRRRLLALLDRLNLRLVLSGHTHQYLDHMLDGRRHVWVPSTGYYFPDGAQDRIGEKVVGVGVLELAADEHRFHLVCPEGVRRHNLLDHPVTPEVAAMREKWLKNTARQSGD